MFGTGESVGRIRRGLRPLPGAQGVCGCLRVSAATRGRLSFRLPAVCLLPTCEWPLHTGPSAQPVLPEALPRVHLTK